ncbi:MAG: PAS domain-containing protein [Actinomycetota bacterium]
MSDEPGRGGPRNGAVNEVETGLTRNSPEALAAIIESSSDAIYSKDTEANITSWNAAAEHLYGYSADEAIGRPISMIVPSSRAGEEMRILERILGGERIDHYETQRVRKDGAMVDVSISVSPVHDETGKIVEAAVIARDITRQKQFDEALADERRAQAALNRKRALELNDAVVQSLAVAKMALETGHLENGLTAVTSSLERAKGIVAELLEHREEGAVEPGDLTRDAPVEVDPPPD